MRTQLNMGTYSQGTPCRTALETVLYGRARVREVDLKSLTNLRVFDTNARVFNKSAKSWKTDSKGSARGNTKKTARKSLSPRNVYAQRNEHFDKIDTLDTFGQIVSKLTKPFKLVRVFD